MAPRGLCVGMVWYLQRIVRSRELSIYMFSNHGSGDFDIFFSLYHNRNQNQNLFWTLAGVLGFFLYLPIPLRRIFVKSQA